MTRTSTGKSGNSKNAWMRGALSAAIALLCTAVLAGCATARPKIDRFHNSGRVNPADYPDVPAVALLDRSEVTLSFSAVNHRPYAQVFKVRRIQILNEKGLAEAKAMLAFDAQSAIFHLQGAVIHPDGSRKTMTPDLAVDLPRYKKGSKADALYGGVAYKLFKVLGARVGDVIEYSYVRVLRDPRWLMPLAVGSHLPTVRGEVVIDHPTAFDVDYRVTRFGRMLNMRPNRLPTRVKDPKDPDGPGVAGVRHVFLFKNEKAIFPEPAMPALAALTTQVHVQLRHYTIDGKDYAGYRTFDDVGRWYTAHLDGNERPDSVVKEQALALGGARASKSARLAAVQRFVQDQIADVPTFLHLGALRPRPSGQLIRAGLGDAKDQAALTRALLRAMALDGFPVLVSRAGSFAAVPDLPTPAPFNHVIIAVPDGGRYAFIDPSAPHLPVGRLPGALQGERGLLVRPDGSELIDLPVDRPADNTRRLDYRLSLSHAGQLDGMVNIALTGLDAAHAMHLLNTAKDPAAALQAWLQPAARDGLRWERVQVRHAPSPEAGVKLTASLHPASLVERKHDGLYMNVERVLGRAFDWAWRESRRAPVLLEHVGTHVTTLEIALPEGHGVDDVPPGFQRSSDAVDLGESWAVRDGKLVLRRTAAVLDHVIDAAHYTAATAPIRALWASHGASVRIYRGGARGSSSDTPF